MTMLVHFFFLEALLLENFFCSMGVVFGGQSVVIANFSSPRWGCWFSFSLFFFSWLCVMSFGHLAGADAWYN
jgi:hypothetical protein